MLRGPWRPWPGARTTLAGTPLSPFVPLRPALTGFGGSVPPTGRPVAGGVARLAPAAAPATGSPRPSPDVLAITSAVLFLPALPLLLGLSAAPFEVLAAGRRTVVVVGAAPSPVALSSASGAMGSRVFVAACPPTGLVGSVVVAPGTWAGRRPLIWVVGPACSRVPAAAGVDCAATIAGATPWGTCAALGGADGGPLAGKLAGKLAGGAPVTFVAPSSAPRSELSLLGAGAVLVTAFVAVTTPVTAALAAEVTT